jgi:hypothetical protein
MSGIEQAITEELSADSRINRFFSCTSSRFGFTPIWSDADYQLRRTMETMLLSYPELIKRLEKQGKPPILLDILQEAGP